MIADQENAEKCAICGDAHPTGACFKVEDKKGGLRKSSAIRDEPGLDDLGSKVDLDSLLRDSKELRKEKFLSPDEVEKQIFQLNDLIRQLREKEEQAGKDGPQIDKGKYVSNFFKNTRERIDEATPDLKLATDKIFREAEPLIEEGKKNQEAQKIFNQSNRLRKILSRGKLFTGAAYLPTFGVIITSETTTDWPERMHALAAEGSSYESSGLHHELIHKKQFDAPELEQKQYEKEKKKEIIKKIVEGSLWVSAIVALHMADAPAYANVVLGVGALARRALGLKYSLRKRGGNVLQETQAHIGSKDYGTGSYDKGLQSFMGTMRESYKVQEKDKDRIIDAYLSVKKLYALGLDDAEIGKLVRSTKWDDDTKSYDLLQPKIQEIMTQRGLTENDVEDLILARDLRTQTEKLKIKKIAQEELKNALEQAQKDIAELESAVVA